jgi:uncharacterized protein
MRHLITAFLLFCSFLSFAQEKSSFVKKLPVPHRAVNDFGRFLTSSERTTLDIELKSYLKRTSNALVIVTLDSLTDPKTKKEYTVEEAAWLYFNTWGIGDSIKNNGVLLLASRKPRRVRIEVGKGLTALDDFFCQGVIDNNLVPAFKKGYYFTGFTEAITELENRFDNPPAPEPAAQSASQSFTSIETHASTSSGFGVMAKGFFQIVEFIFGIIVIVGIAMFSARNRLPGGYYSRGGYRRHGYGYWPSNDNERWNNNNSSSADFFSGSSDSSSSSSSSSSSDSYSGGSSSGGGASGSW